MCIPGFLAVGVATARNVSLANRGVHGALKEMKKGEPGEPAVEMFQSCGPPNE